MGGARTLVPVVLTTLLPGAADRHVGGRRAKANVRMLAQIQKRTPKFRICKIFRMRARIHRAHT